MPSVECDDGHVLMLTLRQSSNQPGGVDSLPTRRSSDLANQVAAVNANNNAAIQEYKNRPPSFGEMAAGLGGQGAMAMFTARPRSEEHTSELQSRRDLVCRVLLDNKKNLFLSIPLNTTYW